METSTPSLAGASCPAHAGAAAVAACTRCGVFVCADCRQFYDYQPLCTECYGRRSHTRPASSRARWSVILAVVGLALMVVPLGVPAVVMAHAELAAIHRGEAPPGGLGYARAGALLGWLANVLFGLLVVVAILVVALVALGEEAF